MSKLLLMFSALACCATQNLDNVLFLVRSQSSPHDAAAADELKAMLLDEGVDAKNVICLHELDKREQHGKWTLRPWIANVWNEKFDESIKWLAMLEPTTRVNAERLSSTLSALDHTETHFLGHALNDNDHDIMAVIHHYHREEGFSHPFLPAGMLFSRGLVEKIGEQIKAKDLPQDTHIDVSHELVRWLDKELSVRMVNSTDLCDSASLSSDYAKCATYAIPVDNHRKNHELRWEDIVIGIKTTKLFHGDRIPIIQATYGDKKALPEGLELVYMSDFEDETIPSLDLTKEWGEQVNQKKGHCAKTDAILKHFGKYYGKKKWFVINDDDTLMDLGRLKAVLNSYSHEDPYYIGERYGQGHARADGQGGYDYVTMGGGMALSAAALKARNECRSCYCSTPDTFDDMTLGTWMRQTEVPCMHEPGFHQAEATNYHPTRLRYDQPLSFHKFLTSYDRETSKWGLSAKDTIKMYQEKLIGGTGGTGWGGSAKTEL